MRILRAKDRVAVPWKNGGGTTREVFVFPPGAGFNDFGWRISIAQVDRSGPFSVFPDIDRHLAMLKGRVALKIAGRAPLELTPSALSVSFPGDVPAEADVIEGPATDLNLMARRAAFFATMVRRTLHGRQDCITTTLVFPLTPVIVNDVQLDKDDALLADAGETITIAAETECYWIEITNR